MKKIVQYFIIVSVFFIILPFQINAARGLAIKPISPMGTEIIGENWLFVIGINTYIHWPRLETAVNDATSLRDILLSRYNYDKEHLIEIYDEQATRKGIIEKLRYLAKKVNSEDSLIIFYAGHGHLDSITKEGSWIPVESELNDADAWISNHDIRNYLRIDAIKAKHVLLISDSCFSGDFFRGYRGKMPEVNDALIKKAYELTSRQAITSGGLEPVSDTGFAGNSVFSFFLLRKLKENKKTFLIPSDFFADVRAGVAENANQFPLFGTLKDTGGSEGGELVLFLKQEVRGDALNAELNVRKMEIERLNNLEKEATAARQKESDEIAKREKELSILDSRIEKARKSLGEVSLNNDNSLDSLLAMVRQKKDQEQKLEQLRVEKEEQELIRQKQIDELRKERNKKIIDMLSPEVEKYQEIVSSKYGHDLKSKAWKSLLAKCPTEWCKNINEGQYQLLLMPPDVRSKWLNLVSDKNNSYKALYKCYLQTTPNWGGAIVEIQEGELIVVVESIDEDGWVKANTLSGKEGYVHTKWLTK